MGHSPLPPALMVYFAIRHPQTTWLIVKTPHLLLASPNARKLLKNVEHLLDGAGKRAIAAEITTNVVALFRLGESHFNFAVATNAAEWRQVTSRLYYAAYNIVRAVRLDSQGVYSQDSSEHKKVDDLPTDFPNLATYTNQLPLLREDRNLCDYDHTVVQADLVVADAKALVTQLLGDARAYLQRRGIPV